MPPPDIQGRSSVIAHCLRDGVLKSEKNHECASFFEHLGALLREVWTAHQSLSITYLWTIEGHKSILRSERWTHQRSEHSCN